MQRRHAQHNLFKPRIQSRRSTCKGNLSQETCLHYRPRSNCSCPAEYSGVSNNCVSQELDCRALENVGDRRLQLRSPKTDGPPFPPSGLTVNFLLDTNFLSELRKSTQQVRRKVLDWSKNKSSDAMYISSISILEIEIEILRLRKKDSRQSEALSRGLDIAIPAAFADRILSADAKVAKRCALLHVPQSMPERDALIAATAIVHDMTVVTRNTSDFGSMANAVIPLALAVRFTDSHRSLETHHPPPESLR